MNAFWQAWRKDIIRGGWGIYADFGYTNSNVLFAAGDSTGEGFGNVFNVIGPSGIDSYVNVTAGAS